MAGTRGINFLDKWIAEHLPDAMTDDPIAISDLADQAMQGAQKQGIACEEIADEVGSVFFEALQNREGGIAH